jgi:DNA-binding Xre family transcriptional regulator
MYITYQKLWELLHKKGLSKNDLCQMSGISSRTVAKLTKNESVTTDTLTRICDTLGCELFDILETAVEAPLRTLYETYRHERVLISEDEFCRLYEVLHGDTRYLIKEVKKKAGKRVLIHCAGSSVTWRQFYPAGITAVSETTFLTDLSFVQKDAVCLLLIDGGTVGITGLDEGLFVSALRPYEPGKLCVMSKARFKLYTPA